jgi:Ca2+-binding EF-hand superfamily protein
MYRVLLTLPILALAWAGAPVIHASDGAEQAARMRFQSMDRNGDGVITRDEWQGSARSFMVHDWNGDGRLSGDEVRIGGQRNVVEADHDPNRFERNLNWTLQNFNALDHNRDRRLTPNEWHFDAETFKRVDANGDNAISQQEFVQQGDDDARDDSFDDLDSNNNGLVEQREWYGTNAAFNRLDRNKDGVLSRYEVVGAQESRDTWDQFASLDYDNSGTLSRNEWHWSMGSFDRRDSNHDGVVSRQEFDNVAGADRGRGDAVSQTVQVDAQRRWTDSGLDVRRGDVLTFASSGQIQMSDNASDTATPKGSTQGRGAPDAPILNQLAGALIAKVGDYGPILVGDKRSITAPVTGRLYLGVNDDHLPDNRGAFTVSVGIQPRTF